jgi:hypothetical protein
MKQKDVAVIIVIAAVSAIISLFVSKAVFSSSSRQQQASVVQPITNDFPQPDSQYFNSNSFDPGKLITVTQNNNSNPFSGTDTSQQ